MGTNGPIPTRSDLPTINETLGRLEDDVGDEQLVRWAEMDEMKLWLPVPEGSEAERELEECNEWIQKNITEKLPEDLREHLQWCTVKGSLVMEINARTMEEEDEPDLEWLAGIWKRTREALEPEGIGLGGTWEGEKEEPHIRVLDAIEWLRRPRGGHAGQQAEQGEDDNTGERP